MLDAPTVDQRETVVQEKWGTALEAGFLVIPTVLIHAQSKLGLDSIDLAVLLNLITHWWEKGAYPFVAPKTIAKRVGVDTRTIERHLKKLEDNGFILRRRPRRTEEGIYIRNYDLNPLADILRLQSSKTLVLRTTRPQFKAGASMEESHPPDTDAPDTFAEGPF
jgi:predicted transcriptional regulator